MREVAIEAAFSGQIEKGKKHFFVQELPRSWPTCTPGEWLKLVTSNKAWTAFVNQVAKETPSLWIMADKEIEAWPCIEELLDKSLARREMLYPGEGKRLVYGQSDGLPGVIVDQYDKHILVQINTAGMDRYRLEIKKHLERKFSQHQIILFDQASYRAAEGLPVFEPEWNKKDILEITDSGFHYELSMERMQKIGFYYDHRDNRNKFEAYLKQQAKKSRVLDLFCYLGSWGLHAARAGGEQIDLVDQADLSVDIDATYNRAKKKNQMQFHRSDVFKFLDQAIAAGEKWDVIICDPPAFCKSQKQKTQALSGYQKLYNKLMKLLLPDGTLVAASCTKYVSLDELCNIVDQQAKQAGRKICMRDLGVQGKDHPFSSLKDSACYIKYALYAVE